MSMNDVWYDNGPYQSYHHLTSSQVQIRHNASECLCFVNTCNWTYAQRVDVDVGVGPQALDMCVRVTIVLPSSVPNAYVIVGK